LSDIKKVIEKKIKDTDLELLAGLSMGRPGLILSGDLVQNRDKFKKLLFNMIDDQKKEIWADNEEMESWFEMASIFLRDGLIYCIIKDKNLTFLKDTIPLIKEDAMDNIISSYQSLEKVRQALDLNLNKSITWNYVGGIIKALAGVDKR
jgi:hypothetical protein